MSEQVEMGDVRFVSRNGVIAFRNPEEVVCARSVEEVLPCLARVEEGIARGLHAAGCIAYEAAPAFDAALAVHPPSDFPLLWFGLYPASEQSSHPLACSRAAAVGDCERGSLARAWRALVSEPEYRAAIKKIRALIAAGDTYQVNYTFPLESVFRDDLYSWFLQLCSAQRADYCAFVHAGRFCVLSASPELFFRLDGEMLVTRPMKGTRPRGRWGEEDRRLAAELGASDKDRAENVMIVDLLRNDMGRIAETGSVAVARLFDVERYETVWQMTSTITARTKASVPQILAALFPSGSVTGAPKVRTMEIIRALEPFPRGVYCGTVGWWSPGRQAEFNVAIRTITADLETGVARYGVGGGITWGSTAAGEYEECRVKAVLLSAQPVQFELIESLLFDGEYFLLEYHMARLKESADYFGFAVDLDLIEGALVEKAAALQGEGGRWKVRLLVARDSGFRIEAGPAAPTRRVRVGFAREPVDENDQFLYHKTTHRLVYERARASRPDCDDVVLWNRRGEVTESTTANVVIEVGGRLLTPPVSAGLLAGTMRAQLLAESRIQEHALTKADVAKASAVHLINSVRKWIGVDFLDRSDSSLG